MLRICRDRGIEIEAQDVAVAPEAGDEVAWTGPEQAAGPAQQLSVTDRHEYVLALFKYGLIDSARDLALVMNIAESAAQEMCDELVDAGLLDAPGAKARG